MYRAALLLFGFLFLWGTTPEAADAQTTGTVQGRVVTETGGALAGVQASIDGTDLGGLSNRSGRYVILNVPEGEHTLTVESLGYGTASATITVEPGQVTTQDFQLGQEPIALGEVRVTVGSRAAHTAADELPVPVDVYTVGQLEAANAPDFLGTIEEIAPSIYVPQEQISDLASGLRPFQLRGMNPDQALVLINGKRRHRTASVAVFGNSAPGASGVDMNALPQMAIAQVEVLRDGASAQYGSDAIAGVINLGLKNEANPLTVEASVGKYYPDDFDPDGFRNRVAANFGVELFGGVLNLTGEYARRNPTERAGADPRPQLICGNDPSPPPECADGGDADVVGDIDGDGVNEVIEKNNPVAQPNHLVGDGFYENELIFANYERPVGDDSNFYLYGGASARMDLHSGFYRRANDNRNWPTIHPEGFLPTFDVDTRDLQLSTGVEGEWGDWLYDVGGQFGQNRIDIDITNTHNASLGPCLST
ncbi:MAG: TonB-dependent receptor, partial [Longimicrobiales bacterium]